jgi:hypothetical protein
MGSGTHTSPGEIGARAVTRECECNQHCPARSEERDPSSRAGKKEDYQLKIENVANVAVIGAAVVLIGLGVYDRIAARSDIHRTSPQALLGQTLELPQSLSTGTRTTAVMFVSKNCHFCSDSMPFYLRISTLRPAESGAFRLLAVTPMGRETSAESRQYFVEHGVPVDGIVQMPFGKLGIAGTPTLALLDRSRRVVKVWTGRVSSDTENEIIATIQKLCPECVGI